MDSTDCKNVSADWRRAELIVSSEHSGVRLDNYLGNCLTVEGESYSRAMFQQLIKGGHVLVQGVPRKSNYRIHTADRIEVSIPPPEVIELTPEPVAFDLIFEDPDIIVISKPPGLVVHPAAGNMTGTLVHGLLHHCKDLTGINGSVRPGIVHRLDKDTSGIMVVAKNDRSQQGLVAQFKKRKVTKKYCAVVEGVPAGQSGTLSTLIGRHPVDRKRMAVNKNSGKEAITHWRCLEAFDHYSVLEVRLETGRTHQIRVHLAHMGVPIVGDAVYGLKKKQALYKDLGIRRQFLHAFKLSFYHPVGGEKMTFEAPLFPDMESFIERLRQGSV